MEVVPPRSEPTTICRAPETTAVQAIVRSRGCTRTSRGGSTATSRSIVRPPVAAASGAPEARPPGPSARVIDPPRSVSIRRPIGGPGRAGQPRPDHRVVGPDMTVEVLVGPAESLGIQPLVVAHRPDRPSQPL